MKKNLRLVPFWNISLKCVLLANTKNEKTIMNDLNLVYVSLANVNKIYDSVYIYKKNE